MEDFGEYSDLVMILSGEQKATCPEGWEGRYYPAYIPEGYTFYRCVKSSPTNSLMYVNAEGKFITFSIVDYSAGMSIDAENMSKAEVFIGNREAVLYVGETTSSVVINYEDYVIFVYGSVPKETIIKIAKNISER